RSGWWSEGSRGAAEVAHERTRFVSIRPEGRVDRDGGEVVPGRCIELEPQEAVGWTPGCAVEQLVLAQREPRIDRDEALDARDSRVGSQASRVLVERSDVGGAGGSSIRPNGERQRRELALTELLLEEI